MSRQQYDLYQYALSKLPKHAASKIKSGLPPDKKDNATINAFLNNTRQISNSTVAYGREEPTPKIERAVDENIRRLQMDPNHRALVYSQYLKSGVQTYAAELEKRHIPYAIFDGSLSDKQRQALVDGYNNGKYRVLLVTGAGSQGLDLKGTKLVQILEPHWNEQRPEQTVGRAIRYQSHSHLPETERHVHVQKFISVLPKTEKEQAEERKRQEKLAIPSNDRLEGLKRILGVTEFNKLMDDYRQKRGVERRGKELSADEYMMMLAEKKNATNQQFLDLLKKVGSQGVK